MRILFQFEATENPEPETIFELFRRSFGPEQEEDEQVLGCDRGTFKKVMPFIRDLYFGVMAHKAELDRLLSEASEHWRLDRMSRVDRNVMRLALYEMIHREDIPAKVSINEAIELGKEFGADESGAFINGILDRIHRQRLQEDQEGRDE